MYPTIFRIYTICIATATLTHQTCHTHRIAPYVLLITSSKKCQVDCQAPISTEMNKVLNKKGAVEEDYTSHHITH